MFKELQQRLLQESLKEKDQVIFKNLLLETCNDNMEDFLFSRDKSLAIVNEEKVFNNEEEIEHWIISFGITGEDTDNADDLDYDDEIEKLVMANSIGDNSYTDMDEFYEVTNDIEY